MDKKDEKQNNHSEIFPPVVAVLGHVDHGKTTLLDAIRRTNVAEREHGGITQKIGASSIIVEHEGKKRKITFIDTPGHEAFSKMRGRGVQAADVALLIVSSIDGVMPQTRESINLIKASKIPFIVVLTKSDLPDKNPEKAKQQLLKEGLTLEGLGGDTPVIEISAKTNLNIKELLDLILLVYDLKEASDASFKNPFAAVVIESRLDPKAGPRVTIVVKNGTVKIREDLDSDGIKAKVRNLINDKGEQLKEATVGEAVEILGFETVPSVGGIVTHKGEDYKEPVKEEKAGQKVGRVQENDGFPSFVLCTDSQGSLEAILEALPEGLKIAMQKTGDIETSDVLFAKSIGAVVLGFNIKIKPDIAKLAQNEKVLLRNYTLIYEMLDEINDLLEGKRLAMQEQIFGRAKILDRFPFEKTEVLGLSVLEGRVAKGDKVRITRGDEVVGESNVVSVRQGKDQTSKVEKGQECGVVVSPILDFTIGDMLICHS